MAEAWLGCGRAAQQARRAEIFIDVRPMEAEACAADAPVCALGFRGVAEPWVPDEGDDDGSPVDQVYGESVGSEVNVLDSFSPGLISGPYMSISLRHASASVLSCSVNSCMARIHGRWSLETARSRLR